MERQVEADDDIPMDTMSTTAMPSGSGEGGTGTFRTEFTRYQIGERLGSGGMATVFRAIDTQTGDHVALKVIDNPDDDEQKLERFEREVRAAGRLVHPNVCGVMNCGKAPGKLFMTMEIVEGVTLQKLIRQRGTLPVPIALEILRQLLGALDCAGRNGVVHRDLKPGNVMITPEGVIKLLDFGIAKSQEDATLTATGLVLGTPAFMSPEQIFGGVVDARSDLFSAGVTFVVMLTGKVRFAGLEPVAVLSRIGTEPVPSLLEECPAASNTTDAFLARMTAHEISGRFASAAAALAAMEDLEELPTQNPGGPRGDPLLLRRYVENPGEVTDEIASAGAARELQRAETLLAKGPAGLPAAALALYRASLLDPTADTQRRLAGICQKGNFTFDTVDDPRIADARAAYAVTPTAPGVLKRLADLYRARGHILLAASFMRRYLRVKPTDSHAHQQLDVLLEGPGMDTGSSGKLYTRDIMAGIKTGGQVAPAAQRPQPVKAPGPLTAIGLRQQQLPGGMKLVSPQTQSNQQLPARDFSNDTMAMSIDHGMSRPSGINIHPLFFVVAAVIVAAIVMSLFSKVITKAVDVGQQAMSDNEQSLGRIESNNIERRRAGLLKEARAQFELGNPAAATRQANELLATDPPASQALEGLWIRARARLAQDDRRAARADLEQYLETSSLSDPRREEVKKRLEEIHEWFGKH